MAALQRDLNLLVIEDNPGDYVLIEEYLSEMVDTVGIHHVKTFADAKVALHQSLSFDAILLDLTLPDLSGEPLVEKVVAVAEQIPIIVLTGYENKEFGLKTLSLGVADFVLKDEITAFLLGKVIAYSIERNRVRQSLQKSEKKYRDIFNLSPQPMFLIDVQSRTIRDVNEAAIQQYGYTKEEFLRLHLKDIRPSEELDYFESEMNKIDQNASQFYRTTVKHQRKNGEVFDVDLSTSEITLDGKAMRMALAEDVTKKVKAERQIKQKSDLLAANAKVTGALIKNENWLEVLNKTLKYIGKAVDVDRVYYFENSTDPKTGELLTSQKIEWTSEGVDSELNNPILQNLPMSEFPEIFPVLIKNEVFQTRVKDLPESDFRELLKAQNIISILHFPIFVDGEFHGFIGFDDCTKERVWSEEEVQYLQTLGSNIASAIKIRKITNKLEHSEKRFKALVQEGSDLTSILDEEFRFKYISPSIGDNHDTYLNKKAFSLVHPDDKERVGKKLQELSHEKRIVLEPYRLQDYTGSYHWVETIITNLLNDPAVEGYVANSRNVTQQILRESKLRELSLVAAKTKDIVVITDYKGCITWVNTAFEELTGYTLEEVKGEKPGDFLQGPDTDPKTVHRLSRAMQNRESIEATILNYDKNGKSYWLNMSIDPIFDEDGDCTHFIAIERDVTEKIKRDKELKESLERYDIVNKATSDTIWDLNLETDKMLYNSNILTMFGYKETQVAKMGTWWRNKIHPEDLPKVDSALSEVLKNKRERFQMEYRFKAADGTYKHILDRAFVIKDDAGKALRMIGAMQDVTQQEEEQERLKLFESVITNTSESVVILNDQPGKHGREIIYVNEAFTKLSGYTEEEVLGETLHFLNGPETDPSSRALLKQAMLNHEEIEVEFINYKKNGSMFWINTSLVPVQNNKGEHTHWVAIGRDITEKKETEKDIKASLHEKETLLAEIHHRVKNNLAVVSGMMQLQAFDSENEELKAKLYDGVVRIKTMATVHELLYQSNSFSQLEFSETLTKLAKNISETLQTGTQISLDINCQPITLNINQAIPASLIVNEVLTNAYKHAFRDTKAGKIDFELTEKGEYIEIVIKDDGAGFRDEDILNSGSLGMHLIDVLSEQLGGENNYKNADKGTVFTLRFERQEIKKGIGNANLD